MFLRQCKLLNGKSCEFTTTFVTSIHCVPGYTRITHRRGRGRERDLLAWEVQVQPQGMDGTGLEQPPASGGGGGGLKQHLLVVYILKTSGTLCIDANWE